MKQVYVLLISFFVSANIFAQTSDLKILEKETVYIIVKDSIKLATDIYIPDGASTDDGNKYSTILIRTPYSMNNIGEEGTNQVKALLKNRWVVILQDTRGRYLSEGVYHPFRHERSDGVATTKWIRSQSWSNGKIAGWGGSYVGYTQWAICDKLDVLTPIITSANMYDIVYPEGIFSLATTINWGLGTGVDTYYALPLSVADESMDVQIKFYDYWLQHPHEDAYWEDMNHRKNITSPVFSIAGWYDIFLMGQINDFEALGATRHPDSRLVIGPYAHGEVTIETKYGKAGMLHNFDKDMIAFIKKHFEEEKEIISTPYSFFIINRNEWINCRQWPPKQSTLISYYLNANGQISNKPDINERIVEYSYNPTDPYPSFGGTFLGVGVGPAYQNANVDRKDQIVFEGKILSEPMVLLGEIDATIYASTDAVSTDFYIQLQEVQANGKILNIQEGGKTIYSEGNAKPFPKKIDISVWATGYQINAGNKLRIVISSSLFPRYNRNLNSGEPIFDAKSPRVANQKIYFGEGYPNCIHLPVMNIER